jgi:E3 ubiquitin-protein ligase HUWE1
VIPLQLTGVPPLVSRRVLETLTYLARNHPNVARLLLFVQFPCPPTCYTETLDQTRGKAALVDEDVEQQKAFALVLLLTLLNQPLYMRSVAHLEQVFNFLTIFLCGSSINFPRFFCS